MVLTARVQSAKEATTFARSLKRSYQDASEAYVLLSMNSFSSSRKKQHTSIVY